MTSRKLVPLILLILFLALFVGAQSAAADSSHARIIRLSLVQGDVRFARQVHGDPLADPNAVWETAALNLPIGHGYVLATDNGRAEVEFENGAMAFLKENTVLEFYDLSLHDGARTTRLVLRQGSASFYVNPARGDYFSVTGGDFTVQADTRSSFRLDNYDDGSTVQTLKGRVSVLHKDNTTRLEKGQSLSIKAGGDSSLAVGRLLDEDDFDRWVSGRVDSVSTATAATLQYTNSPYYTSGFADLYNYGSWFSCGGYGYGWRPFGAGFGWSPFTTGQWIWDPAFGWTWVSYQPWGWAPYHYGGWLFDSGCGGWFYSPPVFYGYPGYPVGPIRRFPPRVHPPRPIYRPVTAVFVRQKGQPVGIVPMHPLDQKGKTPLNLEHGVFSAVGAREVSQQAIVAERGQKWESLKSPPRNALSSSLVATTPPARVSKSILEGNSAARALSFSKDSSIVYDPKDHRFVNTNKPATQSILGEKEVRVESGKTEAAASAHAGSATPGTPASTSNASTPRIPVAPSATRGATPPPARNMVPPPAPSHGSSGEHGGSSGRSSGGTSSADSGTHSSGRSSGGTSGADSGTHSSGSGMGHSSSPSPAPAPSSHPSSGRPH